MVMVEGDQRAKGESIMMGDMQRNIIRSIRKGTAQWGEEDRLKIATLLIKAGYAVRLGRYPVPGKSTGKSQRMEYVIEYWEEKERDYSGQMDDLTRALIEGGKGGEEPRKQ